MNLHHRVRAAERTADRHRAHESRTNVCDQIEEFTVLIEEHPFTLAPAVEAGIIAAVERQIRAEEQLLGGLSGVRS